MEKIIIKAWLYKYKVMSMPSEFTGFGDSKIGTEEQSDQNTCAVSLYDPYSKMFEGDIVERTYRKELVGGDISKGIHAEKMIEHKDIGIVVFEKGAFGIRWNMNPDKIDFICNHVYLGEAPFYEVIGNKFQNPDLAMKLKQS